MLIFIYDFLLRYNVDEGLAKYLAGVIFIFLITIICLIAKYIVDKIILKLLSKYIKNNRFKWDNILLKNNVFKRLSHLVPAIILNFFAPSFQGYQSLIEKVIFIYIVLVILVVLDAVLTSLNDIYQSYKISKNRPIKGIIQVVKIFIFVIGAIIIIANLMGESPLVILSGIGALSAILMLIFKDSLLGLVAGIQISANDMVRIGDWVEMPKYGVDGDVIDISLNVIKIANWDRTISTIPTYAFISDSFKNWRGMQEAGGRRIKRSIYIDTNSISFCTEEMLNKFKGVHHLVEHINTKEREIKGYNKQYNVKPDELINGRRLTNIGIFRAYIQTYLKNHPKVHQDMIQMVRQLAPSEHGLPLEIYVFTNDIEWVNYESIQADIFDHILAVAPQFGLRIYQNPTGYDMREGLKKK